MGGSGLNHIKIQLYPIAEIGTAVPINERRCFGPPLLNSLPKVNEQIFVLLINGSLVGAKLQNVPGGNKRRATRADQSSVDSVRFGKVNAQARGTLP